MHIHTQPTYPLARIGGHTPFMGQKKRYGTKEFHGAIFYYIQKKQWRAYPATATDEKITFPGCSLCSYSFYE